MSSSTRISRIRALGAAFVAAALLLPLTAVHTAAPASAATALVADAGDSGFVAQGELVHFLGTAFGGVEPYSFSWSSPVGELQDSANPTAVLDTTDVPGEHTLSLTVTDAAGATASDTVKLLVAAPQPPNEVLNESFADPTPGAESGGCTSIQTYDVEVPANTGRIDATMDWTAEASDYDLHVLDPDGNEQAASTSFNVLDGPGESTGFAAPEPGTWIVDIRECNSVGAPEIVVTASLTPAPSGDPRPVVDAGSTYRFVTGEPQRLEATVEGGTAPYQAGWDLDLDGRIDLPGTAVTADLPPGRHLVSFRVTDADGYERREMVTVLTGSEDRIRHEAVPLTVIGMSDTGINPYHEEFSAETYPDPEVLELTRNFTRHPCEYLSNYPCSALPIPATKGEGYFPERDQWMWERTWTKPGQLYWVPGTKIVGGVSIDDGALHPILDNHGHGTGSASVSAGNRYGYCPSCLVVMIDDLNENIVLNQDYVDISSHSHGYIGGLPVGYIAKLDEVLFDAPVGEGTRRATERGVNVLFAAGNGIGNAFDVPQRTYDSDQTGPAWNLRIGALRRDNQGAVVGDGIPADVSNWGDGNLPSACRTGVYGQCAFGGTSAASPYSAGTFGWVLTRIRDILGDEQVGPREGQVVAQGRAIPGSPYLADGVLTRRELKAAMLKNSAYLRTDGEQTQYPYPATQTSDGEGRTANEGYGQPGPHAADRAIATLLGLQEMPNRDEQDAFFQDDCQIREGLYGGFDRDGDGEVDTCDKDPSGDPAFKGDGELTLGTPFEHWWDAARSETEPYPVLSEPITYFLHREERHEPELPPPPPDAPAYECSENHNEQFMSRQDTQNDVQPCFDSRITSVAAAFRPKGIFTATDTLEGILPAGSQVDVTLYVQSSEPSQGQFTALVMATERELGRSEPVNATVHPAGWTEVEFSFETVRPATVGEHLTIQFEHLGVRSWAYGYLGESTNSHAVITPAAPPGEDFEFDITIEDGPTDLGNGLVEVGGKIAFPDYGPDPKNAGFRRTVDLVQVAWTEAFTDPVYAEVDPETGTWTAQVPIASGSEVLYARGLRDRTPTLVATAGFAVQAPTEEPSEAPLPATGGGLALAGLALLGAVALRRRPVGGSA